MNDQSASLTTLLTHNSVFAAILAASALCHLALAAVGATAATPHCVMLAVMAAGCALCACQQWRHSGLRCWAETTLMSTVIVVLHGAMQFSDDGATTSADGATMSMHVLVHPVGPRDHGSILGNVASLQAVTEMIVAVVAVSWLITKQRTARRNGGAR